MKCPSCNAEFGDSYEELSYLAIHKIVKHGRNIQTIS